MKINFSYLDIFKIVKPLAKMQKGGEGLPTIIVAGRGILLKMLIKGSKGANIRNR